MRTGGQTERLKGKTEGPWSRQGRPGKGGRLWSKENGAGWEMR